MSETSVGYGAQFQGAFAAEDTWATDPSSSNVKNFRCTSFNVNMNKDTFVSNELRSHRQVTTLRHGVVGVSGDVGIELSYGSFDEILAALMFSSWASDGTLDVGTTQSSFRLSKDYVNLSIAQEFAGCVPSSLSLSVSPNSIVTGSFGFMGKRMYTYGAGDSDDDIYASRVLQSGSDVTSNDPFDSFSGAIYEGGVTSSDEIAIVTALDLNLENNLSAMNVVGSEYAIGLAEEYMTVTGTVTAYFSDNSLLNKFKEETSSSIKFSLTDPSANSLSFRMNNIKYTGGDIGVDGPGPITVSLPFQALYDAAYSTIQLER